MTDTYRLASASKAAAFEELVGGSNAAYTVFNALEVAARRFDEDADTFRGLATELADNRCLECNNVFDDNPGKNVCKTCQDWLVADATATGSIRVGLITLNGAAEMALQFDKQAAETRTLIALLRGDNESEDED